MKSTRCMHLNAYLLAGGHMEGAWRKEDSRIDDWMSVDYYGRLTKIAERAGFDSVFFADGMTLWGDVQHRPAGGFEPLTLASALARQTRNIGLIITASTTFYEPYALARLLASLDHITEGRIGWNIVVSGDHSEARNFGRDALPAHALRYSRANEFLEVATALWDSWSQCAVRMDRSNGLFADPAQISPIDHVGQYFRVRGPLNVPASPQGRPLLMQAGRSEAGRALAARYADAVFTLQPTLEDALTFSCDMRKRGQRIGRSKPLKVLPGICPIIGDTQQEAMELRDELVSLTPQGHIRNRVARMIGTSLQDIELSEPLGNLIPKDATGRAARIRQANLSAEQVYDRLTSSRELIVGTRHHIADVMAEWFTNHACDGFNIMPAMLPESLQTFADQVTPILQDRGLLRTPIDGQTLRQRYDD